jgi:hypothetical protein
MSKGYNMDADILERQEPYIISKSHIDGFLVSEIKR